MGNMPITEIWHESGILAKLNIRYPTRLCPTMQERLVCLRHHTSLNKQGLPRHKSTPLGLNPEYNLMSSHSMHIGLVAVVLLCLPTLSLAQGGQSDRSAESEKKVTIFQTKELKEPVVSMMKQALSEIKEQMTKESPIMKGMRHESCTAHVILWQSYVWLGYEINEELVVGGSIVDQSGQEKTWLMSVTRAPYSVGKHQWTLSWLPMFIEPPPPDRDMYDWKIFEKQELQQPGAVLRWCQDRHYLERVQEFGTPLLQRWVFADNWVSLLGRGLTKEELEVVKNVLLVPSIKVPLQGQK